MSSEDYFQTFIRCFFFGRIRMFKGFSFKFHNISPKHQKVISVRGSIQLSGFLVFGSNGFCLIKMYGRPQADDHFIA